MDGLGSLRLPQSANVGDSQVKIRFGVALLPAGTSFGVGHLRKHYLLAICCAACPNFVRNFTARGQLPSVPNCATS
jgi:hypothetical protein